MTTPSKLPPCDGWGVAASARNVATRNWWSILGGGCWPIQVLYATAKELKGGWLVRASLSYALACTRIVYKA